MGTIVANRWFILAVLFLARTVMAFHFQSVAALGPVLVRELAIDYALLGTLIGLFMLPGVAFSLLGGLLGQRFGDKPVALWGLALMVLGGVWMGASDSFLSMAAGRLVSGFGAVLLNILLAKMVTDWFAEQEIVLAMALFVSSWPIGIGLALAVLPSIAEAASTSGALSATAGVSAIALVFTLAFYRPPLGYVSPPANFRLELSQYEWLQSFLSGMVWTLYNVGFILVLSFGPSFLVEQGASISVAGARVSLATWTVLISLPFGGYLAHWSNWPQGVMAGCFLALAVAIGGLALGLSPLVFCAVIGLLMGPPAGLIMALPGRVLRPENRSAGMGVYYTCYYAGMAGLLPLAGVLRDASQSPSAPLFFGAAIMLGAVVALVSFRVVQRNHERSL